MLSFQYENQVSIKEALPLHSPKADLTNLVSTNPKAISRLISAAVIDRSFQKLLLTQPEEAMARGYNGETFDLTDEDRAMILTIQASSINDFAAQLVSLRENNCSGEWIVRNPYNKASVYSVPTVERSWSIAPTRAA